MNILGRFASWLLRSGFANPEPWLVEWLTGGNESAAQVRVNHNTAQQSSAVFACVQARSQDVAKLPFILYQKLPDGGRRRATDHPVYKLMTGAPNDYQTGFQFREMMQAACDLRGNAYARIVRDGRARPVELIPLNNDWVQPLRSGSTMFYDVRMFGTDAVERLTTYDILHLKDRSDDGFIGKSVIHRCRDVVGLDLAGGIYASKLFANGARPGGVLTPKGKVDKAGRALLKKEWNEDFAGVDKANSVAVLAEEMTYTAIGMSNEDAQFIDGRKLSRSEIAAIFRMPPHKVGIMDNATFSNIEQQSIEYVTDTLLPIGTRWEETCSVALLRDSEQGDFYFEVQFDGLLRGDFISRMQGYALQRQWGRSYNDIAMLENWPSLKKEDGGDERLVPLNYWPMGKPRPDKTQGVGIVDDPPDDGTKPPAKSLDENSVRAIATAAAEATVLRWSKKR